VAKNEYCIILIIIVKQNFTSKIGNELSTLTEQIFRYYKCHMYYIANKEFFLY